MKGEDDLIHTVYPWFHIQNGHRLPSNQNRHPIFRSSTDSCAEQRDVNGSVRGKLDGRGDTAFGCIDNTLEDGYRNQRGAGHDSNGDCFHYSSAVSNGSEYGRRRRLNLAREICHQFWNLFFNGGNWAAPDTVAAGGSAPAVGAPTVTIPGNGPVTVLSRQQFHLDAFWVAPNGTVMSNWADAFVNGGNWNTPYAVTAANMASPGSSRLRKNSFESLKWH